MKVLLVGNGAREHIIAECIAKDADLYVVMSRKNPAIAKLAKQFWIADTNSAEAVAAAVAGEKFDVCFVSPDASLAAGVSDALLAVGPVASPLKAAARIEWDKAFARELFTKYNIPGSPQLYVVDSVEEAKLAIARLGEAVVKPLGLTGGKGVRVSGEHFNNFSEVEPYIHELFSKNRWILIEEKLIGEEFTLQAFSDGKNLAFMPPVQDHKRAFENDRGPNTGGMGSYSTGEELPFLQDKDLDQAEAIMKKAIDAMAKEGAPFKGVLYGQFMATAVGVHVIEFNARFGDPEAMNVLALLRSSFSDILQKIAEGKLDGVDFAEKCTVLKYLVPDGYPDKPKADAEVEIDEKAIAAAGAKVYYASVYEKDGKIFTTASRAFGMLGIAATIEEAEKTAENACSFVKGPLWHRKDIGTRRLLDSRVEHMRQLRGKK
ncbi:MAG: phosphoribosylamine--glycine ligase [Candidatus Micrarchaeota archaeon]